MNRTHVLVHSSGRIDTAMFYVYVLISKNNGKMYIGYTGNLKERMLKHKRKGVHTTSRMGEITLLFYESFYSEVDARRREKYLKTTKGKRALKLMLKESLKNFQSRSVLSN